MRRPRLVIADDNPYFLKATCDLLEESFDIAGHAGDGEAALKAVLDLNPDVLVVDLSMPLMNGLEVASCLQQLNQPVRIVLFTVQEDLGWVGHVGAAVHGYVSKHRAATDLVPAIKAALRGGRFAASVCDREDCRIAKV